MGTCTVAILTKNEENHILDAIASAKPCADQILVVDSGSTDHTVPLAREAGAKVVYREWDNDFAAQRNFALQQAAGDWILYLDADERLTPELVQKVNAIKNGPLDHQYSCKRLNVAFGHKFHHGAFGPDRVKRLFPRDTVEWVGKVHERPECRLPLADLGEAMHHFTYDTYQQWWNKAGQYTTIWAEDAYARGKRATAGAAVGHALGGMVKVYLLQGGFLEGSMGFIAALQHGLYTAMKYMKLVEKQQQK